MNVHLPNPTSTRPSAAGFTGAGPHPPGTPRGALAAPGRPALASRARLRRRWGLRRGVVMPALLGMVGAFPLASPAPAAAHEIPAEVTVQAYVKPDGHRLRLLVRVPLEAMRDVELPMTGPGYLEIGRAGPALREAAQLWIADYLDVYEGDTRLGEAEVVATRVSLPSDRSFATWDQALAHVVGAPLPEGTQLMWSQALMDVLLDVPIGAETSRFTLDPRLAHLGVRTMSVIHFLPPGGGERIFQYTGNPGLVRLDPSWFQAAMTFVRLGFWHILGGIDHLLFVLCLVIPFRKLRGLLPVVTAFTVAHSITLIASALGLAPSALWFPPLVEALIALSIVYMALENIVGARLHRRWVIAFGFGLVHGFGFSFALRESLQFAGKHLLASLLSFNVGVELGQILVLVLAIPVLDWLFRRIGERMGVVITSALVAHTAWHWMTDRGARLLQYRFQWPALDLALLAAAMRWAALLLICVGAAWGLSLLYGKLLSPRADGTLAAEGEG